MCEFCENWKEKETLYQENVYCNLFISNFEHNPVLVVADLRKSCPLWGMCSSKDMKISSVFSINYCPNCGEKLVSD